MKAKGAEVDEEFKKAKNQSQMLSLNQFNCLTGKSGQEQQFILKRIVEGMGIKSNFHIAKQLKVNSNMKNNVGQKFNYN